MTSPVVIRGNEQWNRWFNLNHSPLLNSEGSERGSRLSELGIRLLPVLRYGVIILALCLLLSDSFRLAFSANTTRDDSLKAQPVRNARTVHGNPHARQVSAKGNSGV